MACRETWSNATTASTDRTVVRGLHSVVGHAGILECCSEVLGQGASNKAAKDVANYQGTQSAGRLPECDDAPEPCACQDRRWHGGVGEPEGGLMEQAEVARGRPTSNAGAHSSCLMGLRPSHVALCASYSQQQRVWQGARLSGVVVEHFRAERHNWRLGAAAGIAEFGERRCISVGERLGRECSARCGALAEADERAGTGSTAVDVGPSCGRARGRPRGCEGAGGS